MANEKPKQEPAKTPEPKPAEAAKVETPAPKTYTAEQVATLLAENAALKQTQATIMDRLGALEAEKKPGQGAPPIPSTLKPTGLLTDIDIPIPDNEKKHCRVYKCGIKEQVKFSLDLRVGPCNFASRTGRWTGEGDEAEVHYRNSALIPLTDEEVERVKTELRSRYIRVNQAKDGTILGFQEIDTTNSGGVHVDPVTGKQTPMPRQIIPGRTDGTERPLADILIFEPFGGKVEEHTITVALEKAAAQADEDEDAAMFAAQGIGGFEAGEGGRRRALLGNMAVGTASRQASAGRVLDG